MMIGDSSCSNNNNNNNNTEVLGQSMQFIDMRLCELGCSAIISSLIVVLVTETTAAAS